MDLFVLVVSYLISDIVKIFGGLKGLSSNNC